MRKARSLTRVSLIVAALVLGGLGIVLLEKHNRGIKSFAVVVEGSGSPMILIPGLGCGGDSWHKTIEHFKAKYECHVVTLSGFAGQAANGRSSLKQVRDDLCHYIRSNKLDRPIIVGHSLGGFMALWVGATIPSEVGPIICVDGVPYFPALSDPSASPALLTSYSDNIRLRYESMTREQFANEIRGSLSGMITDPLELEKVAESSAKSDPKFVGQAVHDIMTTDIRDDVKSIRQPTLLVAATAAISNPELKSVAEKNYALQFLSIPEHTVLFAPEGKHFIQLDNPTYLHHEMESFLKRVGK